MATLSTPVFCNHFFPWGVCADPPIKRDEGTSYGFGMFNCHVWWPEGNYNSPFVHNSVHPQNVFSGKSTESLDLDSCCWFPLDPLDLPDQSIGRPKRDFDFALCRAELMLSRSQELVTGATYERTPLCLFVCLFACVCGCVSASVSVSVSARVSIKVCVCGLSSSKLGGFQGLLRKWGVWEHERGYHHFAVQMPWLGALSPFSDTPIIWSHPTVIYIYIIMCIYICFSQLDPNLW